jgi:hypothetical protein
MVVGDVFCTEFRFAKISFLQAPILRSGNQMNVPLHSSAETVPFVQEVVE